MADDKVCVEHALKGYFDLVKPTECQPGAADDTHVLQHTENQVDTSLLSTDTDGYNTADALSVCGNDCISDSELDSFIRAENYINSLPDEEENSLIKEGLFRNSNLELPNLVKELYENKCLKEADKPRNAAENVLPSFTPLKATDQVIFRDEAGQLKRFQSSIYWSQNVQERDSHKCLDCATQISMKDITEQGSENLESGTVTLSKPDSVTLQTSEMEKTTEAFDDSQLEKEAEKQECSETTNQNPTDIKDVTDICDGSNIHVPHDSLQKEEDKSEGTDVMMVKVDNLLIQLETLMKRRSESDLLSDDESISHKKSSLTKPLRELSPCSKQEVSSFIKDAASSMEIKEVEMDDSQSSVELVLSIIREAAKQYGVEEELTDSKDVMSVTIASVPLAESVTPMPTTELLPPDMIKGIKSDSAMLLAEKPRGPLELKSATSSPQLKTNSAHIQEFYSSNTTIPTNVRTKAKSDQHITTYEKSIEEGIETSNVHFGPARTFATGDNHGQRTNSFVGNVVKRKKCVPPPPEDFVTCFQVLKETRSARAKFPTRRCCSHTNKFHGRKHLDMKYPTVKEFKSSTKTGTHSFFETLTAKISLPKLTEKRRITEATVPVKLQSETVWINGELHIYIKDIDRDLAHIPIEKKELYTRAPTSISIDFVREYREEKEVGIRSPSIVKKTTLPDKITSPTKIPQMKMQVEPPPFNTKVDYIYKKDPLVLGTLDRKSYKSRKTIEQKKLKKSRIPAYCVV